MTLSKMDIKRGYLIWFTLLMAFAKTYAQNFDSLKLELNTNPDVSLRGEVLIQLSKDYMNIDRDSAIFWAKQALELGLNEEIDTLIAKAYSIMGNANIHKGNLDEALINYSAATEYVNKKDHPAIMQPLVNNMGIVQYAREEYDKALEYYLEAETLLERTRGLIDSSLYATRVCALLSNIGAVMEVTGRKDEALEYYVKGLSYANKFDLKERAATIYSNIGSLYLNTNKLGLSENNYLEAINIYREIDDQIGIARMQGHLGDLYMAKGDTLKSIEVLEQSIELAKANKAGLIVHYSTLALHHAYNGIGDFKNAYESLKTHKLMSDSIFNAEKLAAMTELELEYKFKEERRQLQEAERARRIWNYGLGAGLVVFMFIGVLIYRNLNIKAKVAQLNSENLELVNKHLNLEKSSLEDRLQFRNKELTTNVMYLMKKNEFINTVSQRLLAMRGKFKKENQHDINKITLDLQRAAEEDVWHEFETHFNRVHSDFYDNLSKQFPNLSLNERKLCAFVKLNLTSKEICAITHQTPNTLQVARTRLRKKLGLELNSELGSFLQQF